MGLFENPHPLLGGDARPARWISPRRSQPAGSRGGVWPTRPHTAPPCTPRLSAAATATGWPARRVGRRGGSDGDGRPDGHLASDDGSVRHTGDNLTGGDDESIVVDLTRVPARVDQIVFTVNSFTGQTFAEVQNAFCRLVDETTGTGLAHYTLTGGGRHTAQIMAKVRRGAGGWEMKAIGEPASGRTFQDLLPTIKTYP